MFVRHIFIPLKERRPDPRDSVVDPRVIAIVQSERHGFGTASVM
jgi:hypothetical protein